MSAASSHTHDSIETPDGAPGEFELLEAAVRELSIAAGLFSADDHRQWLEWMDAATPTLGARMVARAWTDAEFKARALANGAEAAPVLGLPPDWYKAPAYRRRAVRWPRALLSEFGTIIPEHVEIRVHDSNANMRYLVMPMRPAGTDGWSEDHLAAIVTRDTMIGVALPRLPTPHGRA